MRQALRLFLSALAATVVWLVAAPAWASAPQCDARGASTFAPNPKLEEQNASLDASPSECAPPLDVRDLADQGRGDGVDLDFSTPRAMVAALPTVAPPSFESVSALRVHLLAPPSADRDRLERPPR